MVFIIESTDIVKRSAFEGLLIISIVNLEIKMEIIKKFSNVPVILVKALVINNHKESIYLRDTWFIIHFLFNIILIVSRFRII